jgi:hypothetical protein
MTPDEHMLMIGMFSAQMQAFSTLLEILESREIIQKDDVPAFFSLANPASVTGLARGVGELYMELAKKLGVEVNLVPPPAS